MSLGSLQVFVREVPAGSREIDSDEVREFEARNQSFLTSQHLDNVVALVRGGRVTAYVTPDGRVLYDFAALPSRSITYAGTHVPEAEGSPDN